MAPNSLRPYAEPGSKPEPRRVWGVAWASAAHELNVG